MAPAARADRLEAGRAPTSDVSVVIGTYNRAESLTLAPVPLRYCFEPRQGIR